MTTINQSESSIALPNSRDIMLSNAEEVIDRTRRYFDNTMKVEAFLEANQPFRVITGKIPKKLSVLDRPPQTPKERSERMAERAKYNPNARI